MEQILNRSWVGSSSVVADSQGVWVIDGTSDDAGVQDSIRVIAIHAIVGGMLSRMLLVCVADHRLFHHHPIRVLALGRSVGLCRYALEGLVERTARWGRSTSGRLRGIRGNLHARTRSMV